MNKRVLYLQYTNPAAYPPLQHSSRILADRGWEVLFLGRETDDTKDLRFPPHERITVKRFPYVAPGWRQKLHYVGFMLWAVGWALRWRPDWLYVSDPLTSPAALLLSVLPGLSVLYHEHDSPPAAGYGENETALMRLVAFSRRKLAQRVDVSVLPNKRRAQHFVRETEVPAPSVQCVWNCPARREAEEHSTSQAEGEIRVLYHGSLNTKLLPFSVLDALTQLPDHVRLEVVGYETIGSQGYLTRLADYATRRDIRPRLGIRGALPRPELMEHARTCHIGLALMPMYTNSLNMQHMAGASNKPFGYLASGLPLVVADLPDWREMYVAPGYGLACDPRDPDSIAEVLRYYAENPERRRQMGGEGRQRVLREWNYEEQFIQVRRKIEG